MSNSLIGATSDDIHLVNCPNCGMHVNYIYLRSENPKCENGHDLGSWVSCNNQSGRHVYLRNNLLEKCPLCTESGFSKMTEGLKVQCLHVTQDGLKCTTPPYIWIKQGPPCFMNHVSEMIIVALKP